MGSLRLHQLQTHNPNSPNNRATSPANSSSNNNNNNNNNVGEQVSTVNPLMASAATQLILDKIKQENLANMTTSEPSLTSEQRLQLEIQKYVNKHSNENQASSTQKS